MVNSVDSDQMTCSVVTNLGLHCLQRPILSTIITIRKHLKKYHRFGRPWCLSDARPTRCTSDERSAGGGFDPHWVWQNSSMEIDHENFSTVIPSLLLIQKGLVSGERMCMNTGPGSMVS